MISYELKPNVDQNLPDELEVFFDEEGLTKLISQLKIIEEGKTDHIHLMSEAWGGYELSELPYNSKNSPVRHVKIYKVGTLL